MPVFITTLLDHPIIPAFLLANLAIGLWAHMQSKAGNFLDYALASRNLPTGVLVMTLLGTLIARGDLWQSDYGFRYGIVDGVSVFGWMISFFLIGTFIAPLLIYFQDAITMGDLMGSLYGNAAQIFTGLLSIVICILMIGSQVRAIQVIVSFIYGDTFLPLILVSGLAVLLYTLLGGVRVVSYTDVLKTIFAISVFVWITNLITVKTGGVENIWKNLPSSKKKFFEHPDIFYKIKLTFFWAIFPTFVFTPPVIQRMLITDDKRKVRYVWYSIALVTGLVLSLMIWIGISIYSDKESFGLSERSSDVLLTAVSKLFAKDSWSMDCIVVAFLSVLFSTIDSFLHAVGIVLIQDIVNPILKILRRNPPSGSQKIKIAKLGITMIGVLAFMLGVSGKEFILYTNAVFASGVLLPPLLLGILGLKTDKLALLNYVISYIISIPVFRFLHWHRYNYFIVALMIGLTVYFITHIVVNGGIVTLKRSQQTIAEQLWIPSPSNIGKAISGWLRATFNLSQLARIEVYRNRPAQSLAFSMLIFFLYTISSIFGSSHGGEGFPAFMAAIHLVGIALCCGLMLEGIWPSYLKPYFPLYWLTTLFYCLPLGGTITFLRMHEGLASVLFFLGSFSLLSYVVSSRAFVWMGVWGLLLAHVGWYFVVGSLPEDLWESTYVISCLVLGILIACGSFFGHQAELYAENRLYINRALSDSVAHETVHHLSPMRGVSFFVNEVDHSLEPTTNAAGEKGFFLPEEMRVHVEESSNKIDGALDSVIEEFAHFKDIIHSDLYNEMQERVGMAELVEDVLPPIMKRYEDMLTIKVVCKQDFEGDVIRPFFSNVLGNIARNAHLHGAAKRLEITIDGEKRRICVRDNGKGIPPEVLPRIFDLRFTTLKEKGSGVGLAFVKLILAFSGITINCHSRHGDKDSFTEFVIAFPDV